MKETVRIASGQGFWGDRPGAPLEQVTGGPIDYLVMDYLAELTMSILRKAWKRDSSLGYATDFIDTMEEILPYVNAKGIRVLANAGGIHPDGCKDALIRRAAEKGLSLPKIGVVDGDDISERLKDLMEEGHELLNLDTGEGVHMISDRIQSANAYLGSAPLAQCLDQGAGIVISGRVIDAGLILAPLVHEFGWDWNDWDLLATGIVAGHLIECGGQVSGGNFTDWQTVPNLERLGFPIVEVSADGCFVVTKHQGTGGLVNEFTVKEQLLYEIGDPSAYVTPDVVVDLSQVTVTQEGADRVRVSGVKGHPAPDHYKVSASYFDGYRIQVSLLYSWPDPVGKARAAESILRYRAEKLGLHIDRMNVELVGCNATTGQDPDEAHREAQQEVLMVVYATSTNKSDLERLGKEVIPLVLNGPSGAGGYATGRPRAQEIYAFWPALISKTAIQPRVRMFDS